MGNNKAPSQRQLKVGEEIRFAISEVLLRGETHIPQLESASIIISQVKISPDLKNATAYITPLGGEKTQEICKILNEASPLIRKCMNKRIILKYSPKLHFKIDKTFEIAGRINEILHSPEVLKDLGDEAVDNLQSD